MKTHGCAPDRAHTLVIYHSHCIDGFTAAWLASHAIGSPHTCYLPSTYGDEVWKTESLPDVLQQRLQYLKVYVLDYSLPVLLLEHIANVAEKLVVCDHHQTFLKQLADVWDDWELTPTTAGDVAEYQRHVASEVGGADPGISLAAGAFHDCTFYLHGAQCGARITDVMIQDTVGYSFGAYESADLPRDGLIDYVEDYDLWRHELPNTEAIHAYLEIADRSFAGWDRLGADLDGPGRFAELADMGDGVLMAHRRQIEEAVANAELFEFYTHAGARGILVGTVPVVNTTVHGSKVCHELLQKYPDAPFAVTYFHLNVGLRKWSLRSRKGSGVNVAKIAEAFEGGGHPTAAGFETYSAASFRAGNSACVRLAKVTGTD